MWGRDSWQSPNSAKRKLAKGYFRLSKAELCVYREAR